MNAQKDSIRWAYIESIVQYDADTRFAIFQVSTQPDLLSQVAELQKKSASKFQGIIKSLDRTDQEAIYKLVRCEGLLEEGLKLGARATSEEIEKLLGRADFTTTLTAKELYQLLHSKNRTLTDILKLL